MRRGAYGGESRMPKDNPLLEFDDLETQRRSVKRLAELKSEECEIYKLLDKKLATTMSQRGIASKASVIKPGFSVADVTRMQTISELKPVESKAQPAMSKLDISKGYISPENRATKVQLLKLGPLDSRPASTESKVLYVDSKEAGDTRARSPESRQGFESRSKLSERKSPVDSTLQVTETTETWVSSEAKTTEAESKRSLARSKIKVSDSKLAVNVSKEPQMDTKQTSLETQVTDTDMKIYTSESNSFPSDAVSSSLEKTVAVERPTPLPPPRKMRPVQLEVRAMAPRQTHHVPPQPFPPGAVMPTERRFPTGFEISGYRPPILMEKKHNMGPQQVVTRQIVERIIHAPINTNFSLNQLVPIMYAGGLWTVYCFGTILVFGRSS